MASCKIFVNVSFLKMMESKLLVGGKSIVDKTSEQERALEERRKQIAEQQVTAYTSCRAR